MLTRINKKKTYDTTEAFKTDILDAICGDWGNDTSNGLNVVNLGRVRLLQGLFQGSKVAVDVPLSNTRYPAYFHDTNGHSNMVVVEAGAKFVAKPQNIIGGFSFFAISQV